MVDEILKFTKITFLVHGIMGVFFSILQWIPDVTYPLFGLTPTPELISLGMTIGALWFALSVGSLICYLEKEWKAVKIVVMIEIIWFIVGLIVDIINLSLSAFSGNMSATIVGLVVTAIFLPLFLLVYLQQEDKIKPLLK